MGTDLPGPVSIFFGRLLPGELLSPKSILLVEPDERACRAVKAMVQALGYHVHSIADAESAVHVFPYTQANVVLTAYPLLTPNGGDFAAFVKRSSPRTLVVGMVGRLRQAARDALTNGCDDFISKPVDPELLGIKLRQLIGSPDDNWPLAH